MGTQYPTAINMRAAVFASLLALAAAAPKVSRKVLATPLSRGGDRIVGGEDASPGEFPHQIVMLRGGVGGSLMCGGSLISANKVITAAHCCDGQSPSRIGVRVGNHHLYEDDPDQKDFALTGIQVHEDYDAYAFANDICILDMDGEADLSSEFIDTIALPAAGEEYDDGAICTVTGWGTTSQGGSLGRILQKVDVPVVSDERCGNAYGQEEIIPSMICAGVAGKDSCQGDSGGPFMCGSQLSGIVSWGYGCAQAGYPGVYTQTSYFIDWINSH